jgi:threonine/homoserine/homoserine lactone efflux protein
MENISQSLNAPGILDPVLNGIAFGLLLAIMLGPVFFSLLQTSLHEGFKAGAHLAFGVLLSDTTLITICYTFASLIRLIDNHHKAMSWAGGLLLVCFGVYNFFHKIKLKEVDDNKKTVHAHFVLKGYLLNILNPAVLFFWLGVVGMISTKEDYTRSHEITFFGVTLVTVFGTDLLKAYVSQRIKAILKPETMLWINRITGVVLVGFGIRMILR